MAKNKNKKKSKPPLDWHLEAETKRGIVIIILLAISLFLGLGIFGVAGSLGHGFDDFLRQAFGWDRVLIPIILLIGVYILFSPNKFKIRAANYAGLVLFFLFANALSHIIYFRGPEFSQEQIGAAGGILGVLVSSPFLNLLGFWGALVIISAVTIVSLLLIFNEYIKNFIQASIRLKNIVAKILSIFKPILLLFNKSEGPNEDKFEENEVGEGQEQEEEQPSEQSLGFASKVLKGRIQRRTANTEQEFPSARATRVRTRIDIPFDLLSSERGKPTAGDIKSNQEIIRRTLANFGIEVEMGKISIGPTVTQYTLAPSRGVKLSRITALHNDLALALAAHPIRIEAPIPGKSLAGIEVPNQSIATVRLREILDSPEFKSRGNNLYIALGKDVAGAVHLTYLNRMPHLLVAGATGSGKTVCLNSIIMSLLYENSPDELKLILIDPKRVELPIYNNLPHLLTPVVTDVRATVNSLRWAIREMERRFNVLSAQGARDIQTYNAKHAEKIPYIVIIIDELADLMAAAANEVEAAVIRLAQMSRAVGIHLVLATQRPSVDVITGLIKANIPARIAFAVASLTDSRTILDTSGAEKLLGRGDMLYTAAEISKPRRLQGAFVTDREIKNVVEFIKNKYEPASYDSGVVEKSSSPTVFGGSDDEDPMLAEAIRVIFQAGKGSASLLQRRLKVGYARAARLLDIMEEQGIIGPAEGAKPRELLVSSLEELEDADLAEHIPTPDSQIKTAQEDEDLDDDEDKEEEENQEPEDGDEGEAGEDEEKGDKDGEADEEEEEGENEDEEENEGEKDKEESGGNNEEIEEDEEDSWGKGREEE
ncbi:DNA translocase FtsK [Patescibacteria group bacterium]|nr:DNA translocase FtsK [Patescibacteria group bacterium]MBU1922158.1 DNA translocase FtsK [Patescibacteria group bacterium]